MKPKNQHTFANAFSGLVYFFRHEKNGRIQSLCAIASLLLAVAFHVSKMEWIAILICIGGVLSLEMLNSALEKLCDMVHADLHPQIKSLKDIAAGSLIWFCLISAITGALIFVPRILTYFGLSFH